MAIRASLLIRWNRLSISLGATLWILIVLGCLFGWIVLSDLELLLLLALFVIIPLAAPLVLLSKTHHLVNQFSLLILFLQPFASLIGGASFWLSQGPLAGSIAIVWLLFTGLLALMGLIQLFQASRRSLTDCCLALALLYLPIGGTWMVLARWGLQPLGFGVHTDMLTAIHFHFIALAALVIVGLTGQNIRVSQRKILWRVYRVAAFSVLINPLLVATGITLSQVTGVRLLETVAADLLALCLMVIALLGLRYVVSATTSLPAYGLLLVSYSSVVFTMFFAFAYALGAATRLWTITISQMVLVHGWVNALAFGLCGLLGWRLRSAQREV